MKSLQCCWFNFEKFGRPIPLTLGCGVTAYDHDDALNILRERVFAGKELPAIVGCIEDMDISALDQKHVAPNMGLVTIRGVWFPQGYDETK
jgi:hypothetical protein